MSIERQHEQNAHIFITAIKEIASKPENLDNLDSYLSIHFEKWLKTFANTPDGITAEIKAFAEMKI